MAEKADAAVAAGRGSADRILQTARKLFSHKGFAGVSMTEIAIAAGVSKANVFHHFRNKGELYQAVLTRARDEFDALLDELEHAHPGHLDSFETFMLTDIQSQLDDDRTQLLVRGILDTDDEDSFRIVDELLQIQFQRIVDHIPYFHENVGVREEIDQRALAILLTASKWIYVLLLPHLKGSDRAALTPEHYCEQVGEILCRGALNPSEP